MSDAPHRAPDPNGMASQSAAADTAGSAAERRSKLLSVKLRALVAEHTGSPVGSAPLPAYPPGAGLVESEVAWVLIDDEPARRLGSAIAWAVRRGALALHVVAERETGLLARRARGFSFPITVWRSEGRSLSPVEPEPLASPSAPPSTHLGLRELIAAGGAVPMVEHGVVTGEVRGLEVCRVVDDPARPGEARLDVGVGVHDREAFRLLHGDTPTVESLARVVDAVRAQRRPGVPRHPFNRMGAERFLRWRLEDDPGLIGLRSVEAEEPPLPRRSAVDAVPCVARGVDADGAMVIVVCSSGVDLDLIPYAVDARLAASVAGPGVDRTLVVTPERDRLPVTLELAASLAQPVELVSFD